LVDGSIISSGQHTDGCSRKNGKTVVLREANFAGGDVTHSMHQWVEERCLSVQHSHEIAKTIWQDCVAHFSKTCGDNFSGLSRDQVRQERVSADDGFFFQGTFVPPRIPQGE